MILGASVLITWAAGDIAFPAILSMLGLVGLHGRFAWDIRPERRFITPLLLLVLAILFAMSCRYANVRSDQAAIFAWHTIARYFLSSMILVLFLRPPDRLPPSLGLFHLATAMAAGQVFLLNDRYVAFRLSELLSVTLVVFYAAACRRPADAEGAEPRGSSRPGPLVVVTRKLTSGAIMLLAINFGWIGGSMLYRHVDALSFLPNWFWRGSVNLETVGDRTARVGFSTSGRLSSVLAIMEDQDMEPVLSIACDVSPGYLRARAFESYRQSEWYDISSPDSVFPEQGGSLSKYLVGRASLFRIHDRDASRDMTVRHISTMSDAMFTPLGTCAVEAPLSLLTHDDDDIIGPPANARKNLSYQIAYTTSTRGDPPNAAKVRQMLDLPPRLDLRIRQQASKVFAGCDTTADKIEAVVEHFRTNYSYALGLDVPLEQDRLTYFLLEASTGYCEYFASGAAILLRLAGVPTRYITGFYVSERDDRGETWIARNMDAHAWVEAWDQEQNQWTIVEATVQDDLDPSLRADQLGRIDMGGRVFLSQFLQALYDYGLFGVAGWLLESYTVFTAVFLSASLLVSALWLTLFRKYRRTSRRARRPRAAESPEQAALHKMLAAVDRRVKAAGLRRRLDETLHTFSDRLRVQTSADRPWQELADWYLQYAGLRYCRTIDPSRLRQLQQTALRFRDCL